MKSIILCAGYATRLYPLTLNTPKQLLPVVGKPILNYIIEKIEEIDEVDEILIMTNKKFHDIFVAWHKRDAGKFKKKIKLVWDGITDEKRRLGGARGLTNVLKQENINEDILVVAGDSLFDFSLKPMVELFNKKNATTNAVFELASKEEAKRFGVVELDGEKIISFEEKPEDLKTNLMSIALYIFPKSVLHEIEDYVSNPFHGAGVGYLIKYFLAQKDIYGYVCPGRFLDIGVPEDYKKANEEWQ